MVVNRFNLIQMYSKVFGIKGVRFAIPTPNNDGYQGSIEYGSLDVPLPSKAKAMSVLGTPIYEQIQLIGNGRDFTFPDWPLIDIAASKNIVKTPVRGLNGTVKEFIAIDDYQINIRGILINYDSDQYPEDLVYELHEVFKINEAFQVISPVINLLDVNSLVIQDLRLPEVEGYNNIQPFVLQCLSDRPVELVIRDAKKQVRNIVQGL